MPVTRQRKPASKVDFFISRNKADKNWAVWIAWQLKKTGYSVVLQDWDFGAGTNWVLKMQDAITNSKRTIAVLSTDFLKSEFTAPEWSAAFMQDPTGADQKLVPIKVRRCTPTGLLAQIVRIDLLGLQEAEAKEKLLREIKQGRQVPTSEPSFPGTSSRKPPFPGPTTKTAIPRKAAAKSVPTKIGPAQSTADPVPIVSLTAKEAAARIDQHRWGVAEGQNRYNMSMNTWLGAVLVPSQQGAPYVDVLELGNEQLQEKLRGLAIVGTSAVFRGDRGTKLKEEKDHLLFTQSTEEMGGLAAVLQIHADGTLVYRMALGEPSRRSIIGSRSLGSGYIIDEKTVRSAIGAFIRYGNAFYKLRRRDPGNLYLGSSLSGIQQKYFGQPPTVDLHTFTFASHRLNDPLHVPDAPFVLTVEKRRAADTSAKTMTDHFARRFRLEGAYYPTSGRS